MRGSPDERRRGVHSTLEQECLNLRSCCQGGVQGEAQEDPREDSPEWWWCGALGKQATTQLNPSAPWQGAGHEVSASHH